jgi:Zn-dependent peptidase ImmA (M78 family)
MKHCNEWHKVPKSQQDIILKHQTSFPIKVGAIAKELGLKVQSSTLKAGISGEIKETNGTVSIKISRHDSKERQRFTLAHEIAHFLLHKDEIKNGIEDTALFRSALSNKLEVEANKLAADIVMPLALIHEISFPQETRLEVKIEQIASIAELSIPAIEIRLGKKGF